MIIAIPINVLIFIYIAHKAKLYEIIKNADDKLREAAVGNGNMSIN